MSTTKHIALCCTITLTLSLAGGIYTAYLNESLINQKLNHMGELLAGQWRAQFLALEHGLRGLRGAVVAGAESFDQEKFNQYIASRELPKEFPSSRAFGVVKRVSEADQAAFIEQAIIENSDFSFRQFNPHPGDRYVLQYLAPVGIFNDVFGLDLGSEEKRRMTFDDASAKQTLQISPPLKSTYATLHNSPDYIAVLAYQLEPKSENQGWVVAPLFIEDLFNGIDNVGSHIAVEVTELGLNFNSKNNKAANPTQTWIFGSKRGQVISHISDVALAGRQWQLKALPTQHFYATLGLTPAWTVSIAIALIGALLSILILLQHRRKEEQEFLEKSQREQLGALIDAAPCGMMFINSDYQFIAVNKQLCHLTGYTRKQLLESSFQLIMGETDDGNNLLMCSTTQSNLKVSSAINFEMMVKRSDNSIFPAAIGFSTLRIGQTNNIVATLEDISNRRIIERKTAESEAMFRELANAMPQHVWTADAAGTLTYVNQRCAEYFGETCESLVAGAWIKHIHPEDKDYVFETGRKCLKSGDVYRTEFRMKRHDGRYIWHMSRAVATRNSNGEILSWYGTNTDISDIRHAQSELENSANNNQAILNSVIDGIITIDEQGRILTFNHAATDIFGYAEDEAVGKNVSMLMPEPYRTQHDQYLANYLGSGEPKIIGKSNELEGQHRDGSIFKMELRVAENSREGQRYFIGMVRDITERHYNEKLLATQDHILGLIARNAELPVCLEALLLDIEALSPEMHGSILLVDAGGNRLLHAAAPSLPTEYNAAVNGESIGPKAGSCGTAAYLRKQIIVEDIATDPLWDDYRELALKHNLRACWSTPIFSKNQLLGTFALYFSTPRKPNDKHRRVINMATHVASLAISHEQRESQIRQLAFYDSLTKLPNRSLGMDRLNRSIADAQRRSEKLAVIFIDLDSFKTINDSLGHHIGDRILQHAAERLLHCVRDNDTVSRLGGDEFFVILNGSSDNIAEVVTHKILDAMAEPFEVENHVLHATCSIGVALYPNDGNEANTLIRNADAAMYRAKETGRNNVKYYTEEMNRTAVERITLEQEIRKGLDRQEFLLYYQPRINNQTGRIIGVEALVRWQHPTRGLTAPNIFIPVAEQSGLITPLGDWVLDTACQQLSQWLADGICHITMAVNLSPRQFNDKNLIEKIEYVLDKYKLPARYLELEITESMVMDENINILETLVDLKELGVTLAIDDFGTGYSNLSRLKHLPMDVLKIDKSFVDGIPDDPDDTAIASTIIAMAHHLKLKIVAEGVETYRQQKFLSDKHCDEMQGYLFGKPEPSAVIEHRLVDQNKIT
ncbi:EAL domain-containing protein [Simiduia curdlanivorans]|uniref:EAL domain-containing protein n=1 Tax=Simiduia curdlanivorans TaxID=1492769 RepID=A0ABV8V5Z6_9GAMM|nr:EAL domain-containing protein [Simiduia curdlanivorans]MDN3638647.1 EAL domain-containing protein [Simiduia curdlanivorans]